MTRIRVVALDLDGTLVDSFEDGLTACSAVADELGWPRPDPTYLRAIWGVTAGQILDLLWPGRDHARFRAAWGRYEAERPPSYRLIPGAAETLRSLWAGGYVLVLHTNRSNVEASLDRLADLGLPLDAFTLIATFDSTGFAKPDPRALRAVLDRFAASPGVVTPAQTCIVSDRWEDGGMARACGCRFIGVRTGAATDTDYAALGDGIRVVDSIANVPDTLTRLGSARS